MGKQEKNNMKEVYCNKHDVSPQDEKWDITFQELTGEEPLEPFTGQVCPICYMNLRSKNRKNKRQLKVESLKAIHLRAEVSSLQKIIDAVIKVVKFETGTDAAEMVGKLFPQPLHRKGKTYNSDEIGSLERILPNLIVEAIRNKNSESV